MVLCASSTDKSIVQTLDPPCNSKPGDLVVFDGYLREIDDKPLNPKFKVFEKAAAHFHLDDQGVAKFKDVAFQVDGKGECTAKNPTLRLIG